jgi:hypothetical protein
MTLVYRLFITAVIGLVLWISMVKFLYPKPPYYGQYEASNKRGDYTLKIDRATAILIYTDTAKQRFAYRGPLQVSKNILSIRWTEQIKGEEWEPLANPTEANMKLNLPSQITSSEGVFNRVPLTGWRHWIF